MPNPGYGDPKLIAETIIRQLGLAVKTVKARGFVYLQADQQQRGGVQFTVTPARGSALKVNKVVIRYTHADTYNVEFWEVPKGAAGKTRRVDSAENVYADNLALLVMHHLGYAANPGRDRGAFAVGDVVWFNFGATTAVGVVREIIRESKRDLYRVHWVSDRGEPGNATFWSEDLTKLNPLDLDQTDAREKELREAYLSATTRTAQDAALRALYAYLEGKGKLRGQGEDNPPRPTWGGPAAWPTFGYPLGRGDQVRHWDGYKWVPAVVRSVQLVDGLPWYLIVWSGEEGKEVSTWVLERHLRAALVNPSRARKRLGKRRAAGKLTTTKATRQFCMSCERYIGRAGAPVGRRVPKPKQVLAESHGYCRPCAEKIRREIREQAERMRTAAPPVAANPDGDREAALKLAESFHDQPARIRNRKLNVRWPHKAVVYLGPCARIDYVSSKWDGKRRRYFHEFEDCELFAAPNAQPGGRSLLILTGKFQIKPEGLTG